jgi:hypothetical protein
MRTPAEQAEDALAKLRACVQRLKLADEALAAAQRRQQTETTNVALALEEAKALLAAADTHDTKGS